MSNVPTEKMYPDVLGAITGGVRVDIDVLQIAPGIFPQQAFINQPFELLLLVQNMVDQPVYVTVTLLLPSQGSDNSPLIIDAPSLVLTQALDGGEVGVIRMPMVVYPPSQPGRDIPIGIQVRYQLRRTGLLVRTASGMLPRQVRPAAGAPPPASLGISPFKLQALREITFVAPIWTDESDIMTVYFDIAAKRMPPFAEPLNARYETIWTTKDQANEREQLQAQLPAAREIATRMTSGELYPSIVSATESRFITQGMPLESGEIKAVAKMLTYTLSDASAEQNFDVERTSWFYTLCHALAFDEQIKHWLVADIAVRYLYDAALYDAILLGFKIVQPRVREKLGSADERRDYARKVLSWLGRRGEPDITYVYLPLVLGGLAMNLAIGRLRESPWIMVDQLREETYMRRRLSKEEAQPIFEMMDAMLKRAEDELIRAHIPQ